jgi:peptidyl-tRNA hydrolase, PTH1 family
MSDSQKSNINSNSKIFKTQIPPSGGGGAGSRFLIVGLGNPGNEYANTRHNIGFDVVNAFVQKQGGTFKEGRLAYVAEVKWKGKVFVCVCPTTYMNLSGKAFKYWMDKEKVEIQNTLTIVDDLSLPIDKIRLRKAGTHAGHNGLRDIQAILGTDEYPKLRFGIGDKFPKGMQADFVLSKWLPNEVDTVKAKIIGCVEIIEQISAIGLDRAMTQYNQLVFS